MKSEMSAENWQRIETLFHTALDLNVQERSDYLSRSCANDDLLRREVESLLASLNTKDELFEKPIFEMGIGLMGRNCESSLTGKTVGSYLIEKKLGSGGMGEVYLAEDTRLKRKVALKFLSPALVDDKWAKRQLIKEARASAMLDHPNICAVYGFEEVGNFNFIVMQYIEGQSLSALIAERAISPANVLSISQQILEAMAMAHAHGIIHRDIKPGNIMVTPRGQVKVLDFGLAKFIHTKSANNFNEALSQASQSGLIAGTICYMSPEQLRGEKLDFRSDIFSLGTLLFELVAGERPFDRKSDAETISAILTAAPTLKVSPDFPPGIESLIYKCLEKNKEHRYQSVSEMLLDFQNPALNKTKVKLPKFDRKLIWAFGLFLFALLTLSINNYLEKSKPDNLAALSAASETLEISAEQKNQADKFYNLGRYYWGNRNKENIQKAIDAFTQAINLNPLNAQAYAGLANAYVVSSGPAYGSTPTDEAMPKARAAAREALLLDNKLAESHAAMAVVLGKYEYNWKDAETEFKKSIELNADSAQARYWYSEFLATMGRTDEALIEARKAKDIEPLTPYTNTMVGRILYMGRRYNEALQYYNKIVQKEPKNVKAKYLLGLVYLQKKMYAEALEIFEQLYYSGNEKELSASALGYTYGKLKRTNEARRIIAEMDDESKENPIPPQEKSIVFIGLGDNDKAIEWLEKAYQQHLSTLSTIRVEPLYDDLRSDSRFQNILHRMNLDN